MTVTQTYRTIWRRPFENTGWRPNPRLPNARRCGTAKPPRESWRRFSTMSSSPYMSLVGPRPALFNQDDQIALRTKSRAHILTPGITSWAQIRNTKPQLPVFSSELGFELQDKLEKTRIERFMI
jgi:hypothetical protein